MAEDDGIIQEKKFDFTPEGEVVRYISQEQASLRAIQHARDNKEFYGHRYAQRVLFWEVVGEDESEDFYQVRVAYRPAQGFRGQPGV